MGLIFISIFWTGNPSNQLGASKKIVVAGFCLIIFAGGGLRYLQKEQAGNLSQLNGQGRLTIQGVIDDLPDRQPSSQKLVLKAQNAATYDESTKVSGLALITTGPYPCYQYGDLLEITGQLKEPENLPTGGFDYKSYLAKSDIYSLMSNPEIKILEPGQGSRLKATLFWLKQKFETAIEKLLAEPQASFLAGLILGEKRNLPQELNDAFQKTGTTHIIALSGYNITLVASFFMTIFGWLMLKKSLRFWLAVLAIILFHDFNRRFGLGSESGDYGHFGFVGAPKRPALWCQERFGFGWRSNDLFESQNFTL